MSDKLRDLENLCRSYAVKFDNKGNGHVQLSAHGAMLNYYPSAKNRTVFFNGETTKHCSNWDAVQLLLKGGKQGIKPKKKHMSKNRPDFSLEPVKTNPAGIKHTYSGDTPPWEFSSTIMCWPDILRIDAKKLLDEAEQMECVDAYQDCEVA